MTSLAALGTISDHLHLLLQPCCSGCGAAHWYLHTLPTTLLVLCNSVHLFESSQPGILMVCLWCHAGIVCQVFSRQRGAGAAAGGSVSDRLLFHEPHARHFITLTRTKDWRYVLINTTSKLSSEVRVCTAAVA